MLRSFSLPADGQDSVTARQSEPSDLSVTRGVCHRSALADAVHVRLQRGPNRQRLLELQAALDAHQTLWRPSPFHVRRPDWCADQPELAEAVLGLDDRTLEKLAHDPDDCRDWLTPRLPVADTLGRLANLPPLPKRDLPAMPPRLDRRIRGRKRAQIEAFAAHSPAAHAPLLEWCAGKGHLGRRLAFADQVPVRSLEIDPRLCADATQLAERAGIEQTVLCADAIDDAAHAQVKGRTVVALHACGELHRCLVRRAAQAGAHGYRIAPCCYHLGIADAYHPLARDSSLSLDADAIRLAVTETVTASRHDRRRLARDQAWKLGFIALRNQLEGEAARTFRPMPARWLSGDFADFCHVLAHREGVDLPAAVDWTHWLAVGEQRRAEIRRLELVRHAFRRALELWLVMDLAVGLEEAGFEVQVGSLCDRSLTPRNLMVLAQR
ncbi:methyltransferase [Actinopolymorpha alba]|uniref:methyltransferase n=1 Tax=Actinopolymorpha alba TaxID=533267 RepID=UPI000A050676|nr:methyltransferase [Actinopolymorpha alba]